MEPQPPSAPSPATFARQQPAAPHRYPDRYEHVYNEKDAYEHPSYDPRVQRGSKGSSKSRAHDSVISHPLSPKAASPPSPASSVSSGRKQRDPEDFRHSRNDIPYPPRAHVDSEKGYASPHRSRSPTRVSGSNPDVTAVVYDSGEYHEKGAEDKPVHLLVCSMMCISVDFANVSSSSCPAHAPFCPLASPSGLSSPSSSPLRCNLSASSLRDRRSPLSSQPFSHRRSTCNCTSSTRARRRPTTAPLCWSLYTSSHLLWLLALPLAHGLRHASGSFR